MEASAADVAARCQRGTMSARERYALLWRFGGGLSCVMVGYALLVGVRAVRDLYGRSGQPPGQGTGRWDRRTDPEPLR